MSKLPISVEVNSIDRPAASAERGLSVARKYVPLAHAMKAHTLVQRQAARMLHNSMLSAGLTVRLADPQVWGEWMQLQAAVMQRLHQQNLDWGKGCAILADDYAQIHQANTLSKLTEKQCNLMSQWALLLSSQGTSLMTLVENIHVDYGYWASQKLQPG